MAVPVETARRRQATSDGGGHPTVDFHLAGEQFEMRSLDVKQSRARVSAPDREQAKIGGVADRVVPL